MRLLRKASSCLYKGKLSFWSPELSLSLSMSCTVFQYIVGEVFVNFVQHWSTLWVNLTLPPFSCPINLETSWFLCGLTSSCGLLSSDYISIKAFFSSTFHK
ncbi:hypothetical protein ATANTOWER_003170 [Ataeniobius toweri]|uniref:Uncharacterized protein n=1 Tax=Ataeniobius toweri TaxID=208326 RepID=A0ABU7CEC2_9TELE|nr:hypothetical protein [Ataeniobius toweri]